jgi:hypothetical protein
MEAIDSNAIATFKKFITYMHGVNLYVEGKHIMS